MGDEGVQEIDCESEGYCYQSLANVCKSNMVHTIRNTTRGSAPTAPIAASCFAPTGAATCPPSGIAILCMNT